MPLVVHPSSRCDVCLDPYSTSSDLATSPHTIECGHIFCFGCLHSLNTNTCPLCREPFDLDGVKRLHIGNPLEQDNTERDNAEQGVVPNRADFLLRRISLVSGEGVPEVDADEVVSEVQEWLQSQPGGLNSHIPLRAALDSLQRYKALQRESERDKSECRHLRDQLRNSTLTTDHGSRTSRAVEDNLLAKIEEIETERALEMSQLRSQLQNLHNPRPQYLVINTNPCPPQLNSLPRTMALDTHRRMGHLHYHWRTPWILVVSSLIIFCSIIVLSISAWLTSRFTAYHNYFSLAERDRTRFLLFTSAWTIVFSSFYMIFSFCLSGSVLGSVLFLTWLFWTAGATSMTTALSGELDRKLVSSSDYLPLTSYLLRTQGNFVYLVQLNALEGFAWVTEALVTFVLLAALIRSILTTRRHGMRRPLAA